MLYCELDGAVLVIHILKELADVTFAFKDEAGIIDIAIVVEGFESQRTIIKP